MATIENPEAQMGKKPVADFQLDMMKAAQPFVDAIPTISSMLISGLLSPLAFFF